MKRRPQAELRRGSRGAVLDEDSIKALEVSVHQCREHAVICIDTHKQQRCDIKITQDGLERCVPKSTDAMLLDVDAALRGGGTVSTLPESEEEDANAEENP